jgi:large subunit ribosomal protein L19e
MNLAKKKILAAKTLGVGKERIVFNNENLNDIKEAITKQDIRDLFANHSIFIKEIHGRKVKVKRKNRRKMGSIKKRAINKKGMYIILTRKLRAHIRELRKKESISKERYLKLRKEIKTGAFKSKAHLKEIILGAK